MLAPNAQRVLTVQQSPSQFGRQIVLRRLVETNGGHTRPESLNGVRVLGIFEPRQQSFIFLARDSNGFDRGHSYTSLRCPAFTRVTTRASPSMSQIARQSPWRILTAFEPTKRLAHPWSA